MLNNLQRSTEDPASASPAAHESPNLDQRDSEPKRSFRERFGLTGGISRENLLDTTEEQGSSNRLRRKASARKKEPYQYSPQSPPPSASGRTTPQSGKRRPLEIPEESETDNIRDLATFFRTTAPPSDPRRRPISLVGDPSTAQAHWNKVNDSVGQSTGESSRPGHRPRSGSLGDSLERGPGPKLPHPLETEQATQAHPLHSSPAGPVPLTHPQYQAYHPAPADGARQQPSLPPLQTSGPQIQSHASGLHLGQLSPLRQNPVDPQQSLAQAHYSAESPPHFEVQGPDQRKDPDSLEHGIASELTGHLATQQAPSVFGTAPRQLVSPTKENSPGMPTNQANLQLPPRRGSQQDGSSEPPTPNPPNQGGMQRQQPPAANQNVQRAQTTTEAATGRSTPPPQITAKDMSEEEVNNLLKDYKELRMLSKSVHVDLTNQCLYRREVQQGQAILF